MATNSFSSLPFCFCIFLLCHGSMAQIFSQSSNPWLSSRQGGFRECKFDRLQAFQPIRQVRSQAGITEYFDVENEQFRCSGLFVIRRVIEPRGLLLPRYHNTPGLVYIIQGNGVAGLTLPGCPETYQQQFQHFDEAQGQSHSQKFRDEHQKVHHLRQGDVVALPAGVAHWFYNDGDAPMVAVYVFDINNNANQLAPRQKDFLLAGDNNRSSQDYTRKNIFSGFNVRLLSEALGISEQAAQRFQSTNGQRGEIVRVDHGLQFLKVTMTHQEQQPIHQYQERSWGGVSNGLEENFCALKTRQNIENPNRADTYNPRAGRITRLNSQKFPILNIVQMSATRVNLYQDAVLPPFWNINAHSVTYMIQGQARVQVVNDKGHAVFNGLLQQGQLLIIPQNYVVTKKAEREGCQYIAFKTNANAMVSHIAGKNSIFRALPTDVIANAYQISREEARNIKNNRGEELGAFAPKSTQKRYQSYSMREEESSST